MTVIRATKNREERMIAAENPDAALAVVLGYRADGWWVYSAETL